MTWLVWCDDCDAVVHRESYLGLATATAEDHSAIRGHAAYVEEEE